MSNTKITILAAGLTIFWHSPLSASDFSEAVNAGAQILTADEVAEYFIGSTGHFHDGDSDARRMVWFGEDNKLASKDVGGDGMRSGLYVVTDRGNLCVGWDNRDLPRVRCMDVLLVDGVVHKYNSDGSLSGTYPEFDEGKQF